MFKIQKRMDATVVIGNIAVDSEEQQDPALRISAHQSFPHHLHGEGVECTVKVTNSIFFFFFFFNNGKTKNMTVDAEISDAPSLSLFSLTHPLSLSSLSHTLSLSLLSHTPSFALSLSHTHTHYTPMYSNELKRVFVTSRGKLLSLLFDVVVLLLITTGTPPSHIRACGSTAITHGMLSHMHSG